VVGIPGLSYLLHGRQATERLLQHLPFESFSQDREHNRCSVEAFELILGVQSLSFERSTSGRPRRRSFGRGQTVSTRR
jgi:hypothetical protein